MRERGQKRPADWPSAPAPLPEPVTTQGTEAAWWKAGVIADFPEDRGIAVKYGNTQIAVFNFSRRGQWYATQNMCPHKRDTIRARGLLGDKDGVPKVACPQHKKQFSLESGECVSGDDLRVRVFTVKVEDGAVYVLLSPPGELAAPPSCAGACPAGSAQVP